MANVRMLKIRNNTQAERHLTPPQPPPPAPGKPYVAALLGIALARAKGMRGQPDFVPGVTEVPEATLQACVNDPVVRGWFSGDEPDCEVIGTFTFAPPSPPEAPAVDPELVAARARIAELEAAAAAKPAAKPAPAAATGKPGAPADKTGAADTELQK